MRSKGPLVPVHALRYPIATVEYQLAPLVVEWCRRGKRSNFYLREIPYSPFEVPSCINRDVERRLETLFKRFTHRLQRNMIGARLVLRAH